MRRFVAAALLLSLLLTGCAPKTTGQEPAEQEPTAQESVQKPVRQEPILPQTEDAAQWRLGDFALRFAQKYPTEKTEYPFMAGSEWKNAVVCLRGEQDGPVIYFVCGLHGDETAGWTAGNLLKDATLRAGTVYILSPANLYGAQHDQRKTKSARDANRYFPGKPDGFDAEQIDDAIYRDILDKAPDLVLDLHEGLVHTDGEDDLGNSVICEDVSLMSELIWDVMVAAESGALCGGLTLYGSPPEGSLNHEVTKQLGIPVITVETSRGEALERRVDKQLELAEFILAHEGLR